MISGNPAMQMIWEDVLKKLEADEELDEREKILLAEIKQARK